MKGASAEPCDRTIRPPKSRTSSKIGASQNLRRALRNCRNSERKFTNQLFFQNWLRNEPTFRASADRSLHIAVRSSFFENQRRRKPAGVKITKKMSPRTTGEMTL